MVSTDGKLWEEAKHTGNFYLIIVSNICICPGSIPGMLSLEMGVEIKYIRLEFIEDLTSSGIEVKPLGVRFIEFYGCPMEESLAHCGTHLTRVSTNATAYRHIG